MFPAMYFIVSILFFYKDGFEIKWTHNGRYAIKQKKTNQTSNNKT